MLNSGKGESNVGDIDVDLSKGEEPKPKKAKKLVADDKINFGDVKTTLSSCHLNAKEKQDQFMLDINEPSYFTQRVKEAINSVEAGRNEEDCLVFAIQLLAVRLTKMRKKTGTIKTKE